MEFYSGGSGVRTVAEVEEAPLWIGGRRVRNQDGEEVVDIAPATSEPLARVHLAGVRDVDAAVTAARDAQHAWERLGVRERSARVEELSSRIVASLDDLGLLDARDTGSPFAAMRASAQKGALYLKMSAGAALEMKGHTIPASATGLHFTLPQPWGVVGGIPAYNHPTLFACQKLGPALIAGNTVVLKPADSTPLAALAIARLTEDILPPGVLNVIPGGAVAGGALAKHPDVPRITFTGGVKTGLAVQGLAATSGQLKSITLELGGKNPILVFPDADVGEAAAAAFRGMNFTRVQGQSCGATSRLLIHEALHEEVVQRVVELVSRIRLGLPEDPTTEMGSLISQTQRKRVLDYIESGKAEHAKLMIGGSAPDSEEPSHGAYVNPTVFDHVASGMRIADEEIFGPVLSVISWTDEREAVDLANQTPFGLTASIWTQDIDRALAAARRIEAGYVWVNDVETRYPGLPFGGWKQSGMGVEQGLAEELLSFTRSKSVSIAVRAVL